MPSRYLVLYNLDNYSGTMKILKSHFSPGRLFYVSLRGSMSNPPSPPWCLPRLPALSVHSPPNSQTPSATKNLVTRDLNLVHLCYAPFSHPYGTGQIKPDRSYATTLLSHAQGRAILGASYFYKRRMNRTSIGFSPNRREGIQEVF